MMSTTSRSSPCIPRAFFSRNASPNRRWTRDARMSIIPWYRSCTGERLSASLDLRTAPASIWRMRSREMRKSRPISARESRSSRCAISRRSTTYRSRASSLDRAFETALKDVDRPPWTMPFPRHRARATHALPGNTHCARPPCRYPKVRLADSYGQQQRHDATGSARARREQLRPRVRANARRASVHALWKASGSDARGRRSWLRLRTTFLSHSSGESQTRTEVPGPRTGCTMDARLR